MVMAALAGCLGGEDPRYSGGSISAVVANNTTDVPINNVSDDELSENGLIRDAVREAHENGSAGGSITEAEYQSARRFLEDYEAYDARHHRPRKPSGYYFAYRDRVIAVSMTHLE